MSKRKAHHRCPSCGSTNVEDPKIPGIKAYVCQKCNHMALKITFPKIISYTREYGDEI